MADLYAKRTSSVKSKRTPGVLYAAESGVHDAYMIAKKAKKVIPRQKRPEYRRTFIRQWREFRGLTQEALAERVAAYLTENGLASGYSYASVGRIENGKMPYSQAVLEAMADALGTDPASLLIRDPSDKSAIWSIWDQAKAAERQALAQLAEVTRKRTAG